MIKVNWAKIKPFEKKPFALSAMAVLAVICLVGIIIGAVRKPELASLRYFSAVFVMLAVAFNLRIESRMLQTYLLMAVLGAGFMTAALLPMPKGLVIFFFVISCLAVAASIGVSIAAGVMMNQKTHYDFHEPDRSGVFADKNVMLFAPHEDDEINIYGGLIEQYVKHGSTVRVVFSTNGDFYHIGKLRIWEALKVADRYHIPRENFIFLGYSDSIVNAEGKHIYNNEDGDERLTSPAGLNKTYGTKAKPPYRHSSFTRNNILNDFKSVILEYQPDTLYCCDYDGHSDHRAISLFFEEAVNEIINENPFYRPEVFKGFAYSTAWDGKLDYYSLNALSTHLKKPADVMRETNTYSWADRVRFPVAIESLSHVMQNSLSYRAMMEYSSQTATDHANGILNSDNIFWKRRTDNVLIGAEITATSGDPSNLINFKLYDSDDIKNDPGLPLAKQWHATIADEQKIIGIKLPSVKKISSIVLYGSPEESSKIVNAAISLGSYQFSTGELNPLGTPTVFEFPPVETDRIGIKIKSYIGSCKLLRIEAFEEPESTELQFIKLQNENEDFCYDYIINKSGREDFTVYTYPQQKDFAFDIETEDDGIQVNVDRGVITVACLEGEQGVLTIRSKENPDIYDTVVIRNPDERDRYILTHKQRREQQFLSFPMHWDYYRGLLRRLTIYKPDKWQ